MRQIYELVKNYSESYLLLKKGQIKNNSLLHKFIRFLTLNSSIAVYIRVSCNIWKLKF